MAHSLVLDSEPCLCDNICHLPINRSWTLEECFIGRAAGVRIPTGRAPWWPPEAGEEARLTLNDMGSPTPKQLCGWYRPNYATYLNQKYLRHWKAPAEFRKQLGGQHTT